MRSRSTTPVAPNNTTSDGEQHRARFTLIPQHQNPSYRIAVLVGALVPDASLFVMWIQAKLRGIDESRIWSELYYSAFWQQASALSNSIPLFLAIALLGWWLSRPMQSSSASSTLSATANSHWFALALWGLGLAAMLHCFSDLPLHVDDGHPHFWPISSWIYQSPVSYWDSNHHANIWIPIEIGIAFLCGVLLWRRHRATWSRLIVALALASYPAVFAFWFFSFS